MSDELMNAKDFGYKIKVLKGYTFQCLRRSGL